jgi:hypothetical protein
MTTYDQVVRAATRLVTDDTKDTWGLADAVLAHVPEEQSGKRSDLLPASGEGGSVPERLSALAKRLGKEGVTTPVGEQYSQDSLRHLRDTAVAWAPSDRFNEAAYRTHQEAGSPKTEGGKVLAALAAIARGEAASKPRGIDADAWAKAVTRVESRTKGFLVAANDVRMALKRQPNVPGREPTAADRKGALAASSPTEIAAGVDPKTLENAYLESRKQQLRDLHNAQHDNDTPEEVAAFNASMDQLTNTAKAVDALAQDVASPFTPTPGLELLADVDRTLGAASSYYRKFGFAPGEGEAVDGRVDNIQQRVEFIRLLRTPTATDAEIQAFLSQAG